MIEEHALRKVELCLHQFCLEPNIKSIIDNIVKAADRGYSLGTYMSKGSFVLAPVEDLNLRVLLSTEDLLWPFTTESQAQRFLVQLRNYFDVRSVRSDILGIEGYVLR